MKERRLVEEDRGAYVENIHFGHIAGVSDDGTVVYRTGDADQVVFMRSTAKPVQALPVILEGAAEAYSFSDEEIAMICASHLGEDFHVTALESMLAKTGLKEQYLAPNATYPGNRVAREAMIRASNEPRKIYHNCSGKHIGALTLSKYAGYDLASYCDPDHPAQLKNKQMIAYLADLDEGQIKVAIDGCGYPVFALPLKNIARIYLKLACPDLIKDKAVQAAVIKVTQVMNTYPDRTSGTDRLCSVLLQDPNIVAKGGAKGIYCFGLKKERLGFAFKVSDGADFVWPMIVHEILQKIDYDRHETLNKIKSIFPFEIRNDQDRVIGQTRTVFDWE